MRRPMLGLSMIKCDFCVQPCACSSRARAPADGKSSAMYRNETDSKLMEGITTVFECL